MSFARLRELVSFVRPRELVSFDPWHTTRSPPIGNVFELGGIRNSFVLILCSVLSKVLKTFCTGVKIIFSKVKTG